MKRLHSMPFGAECRDDGSVRFRLWAPAAHRVGLSLAQTEIDILALERRDKGWFELVTGAAAPGSHYSFIIDDGQRVPDPASRFQPRDVHGPSEVIDPKAFEWQDNNWQGLPWADAVIYELHVGAFTKRSTFTGVIERLDHLADLGVTAIELMPVADFPGKRNWGYDGAFPFAPDSSYGRPEHLKELIQSAHARGMMVFLDVVYNHFGPEGNYLNIYAPHFFTDRHRTPWGSGINFDGAGSRPVRDCFVHNALYWLTEYHLDGLRLDAVHTISDDSSLDILTELAAAVRLSTESDRHVHLILENDRNQARYLRRIQEKDCRPETYTAQWNDDIHHALHVLTTGETDGYYVDYADHPIAKLGRCLVEGFAYQGETSILRKGQARGESTRGLSPAAFISFLQNHDQIGNRAFGERITVLADPPSIRAAIAILLLAPSPPMLFMGEEFGATTPFLFFCDFENELAAAVTEGRRNEFAQFARFSDPSERERIPDPNAPSTFEASRLDWSSKDQPSHVQWLTFYRHLLHVRKQHIVPPLKKECKPRAEYEIIEDRVLKAWWKFPDNSQLTLVANLGKDVASSVCCPASKIVCTTGNVNDEILKQGLLPPWSVVWFLES